MGRAGAPASEQARLLLKQASLAARSGVLARGEAGGKFPGEPACRPGGVLFHNSTREQRSHWAQRQGERTVSRAAPPIAAVTAYYTVISVIGITAYPPAGGWPGTRRPQAHSPATLAPEPALALPLRANLTASLAVDLSSATASRRSQRHRSPAGPPRPRIDSPAGVVELTVARCPLVSRPD
ncbi:hypothetical protein VTN96DRAFT_8182 [Rasamsonia emersonii]